MGEGLTIPEERIGAILEDRRSGATELTRRAADVLREVLTHSRATRTEALRAEILQVGERLIRAHPNMAPLVHLVNTALCALRETRALAEARQAAQQALDQFLRERQENALRLQAEASRWIPEGARVLTHSFSATVLSVLQAARARGRTLALVCTESRPLYEGRALAEQALTLGVPVTLILDAALGEWAGRCTLALVGADCVSPQGVVNKIGTRLLALAARERGIPAYVLAESGKFFPFALSVARPHAPTEIWEAPPEGLTIWNEYFETTPLEAFTGIISERGFLSPQDVRHHLRDLSFDPELWSRLKSSRSETSCF